MKLKLGDTARDKITGFEGVVVCKAEFLTGCARYELQPKELKDGLPIDPRGFDEVQLEKVKTAPKKKPSTKGGPRPLASRPSIPTRR